MEITKAPFGKTADGTAVDLYTLTNTGGMKVTITNFGGTIVSLLAPDRDGKLADIVLGFDRFEDYPTKSPYFGAICGRYANRIAKGRFTLDGKQCVLAGSKGENVLHGGKVGFDKAVWSACIIQAGGRPSLELKHTSPDGDEGFPGALSVTVLYTLTDANELVIGYIATADKPTVLNLTNHAYFNLAGEGSGDILGHELTINADNFTPIDGDLIPTGEIKPVKGTPLDFTAPHKVGERIDQPDQQLGFGKGYDHNFVLNKPGGAAGPADDPTPSLAARVCEPKSGRIMEVITTEPGIQFYSGNFLAGVKGKAGHVYARRNGFCLETQHFPDSPNRPNFPTTVLRPGKTFWSTTIYKFSAK